MAHALVWLLDRRSNYHTNATTSPFDTLFRLIGLHLLIWGVLRHVLIPELSAQNQHPFQGRLAPIKCEQQKIS